MIHGVYASQIVNEELVIPKRFHQQIDYFTLHGRTYVVKKRHGDFLFIAAMSERDFEVMENRKPAEPGAFYETNYLGIPYQNLALYLRKDFQEFAGLEKRAVVMGCYNGFQIWSPESFQRMEDIVTRNFDMIRMDFAVAVKEAGLTLRCNNPQV